MESEKVFDTKVKFGGVFSYKDFYKFCCDWLVDECGLDVEESEYGEKISGSSKEVTIKWKATRKVTDYFMFEAKIEWKILGLSEVEVMQSDNKVKMNKCISLSLGIKGNLIRDYEGKWEKNATLKFWRGIYEKYVIKARINEYEGKLAGMLEEFSEQSKAYLTLEGKR